jgi:hypothetical protein
MARLARPPRVKEGAFPGPSLILPRTRPDSTTSAIWLRAPPGQRGATLSRQKHEDSFEKKATREA